MNKLLFILSYFPIFACFAQNLVPNPGFEEHRHDTVLFWEQTNRPFYHFEYNTSNAHSGNCMDGICIWKNSSSEYLQAKLDSPLVKDKKYKVTAYSMMTPSISGIHNIDTIKNLGIYFSKERIIVSMKKVLYFKPSIYLDAYKDSLWCKTESIYTAKGGERYMIIGRFYELAGDGKKENDTSYEHVFRELENFDLEKYEMIQSETSIIEDKYKDIQQESWNIDKVKNERKREKLINDYQASMNNKRKEIQDKIIEINKEYSEKSGVIYSKYNIAPKGRSGTDRIRLYFDDISVSPVRNIIESKENIIQLKNVFFNTGKSDLLSESFTELDKQVKYLNENSGIKIEVSGHTDNVGREAENQLLSENRAKAVAEYLISQGITKTRVSYKGYGSSKPVASNDTDEGKAMNRRVEITILEK
jgi:outer membrane protein OmpA-like peptidoglycan-associated protein